MLRNPVPFTPMSDYYLLDRCQLWASNFEQFIFIYPLAGFFAFFVHFYYGNYSQLTISQPHYNTAIRPCIGHWVECDVWLLAVIVNFAQLSMR